MTEEGRCPYKNWLNSLEKQTQAVVHDYIDRVLHGGSQKNVKALSDGVWEIKIQHRHGALRVYFAKINGILLLLGGGKKRQDADIARAKRYWRSYVRQK